MLGLAHWQYGRMLEKEAWAVAEAERPTVTISGVWDNNSTVALDNQPHPIKEGEVGWRIFTPLRTSKTVILVDRGWMPLPPDRTAQPDFTALAPTVLEVRGVWAPFPQRKGWFKGPDTTTHPRILAWLNPALMISGTHSSMYLQASTATVDGLDPQPTRTTGALKHASYALQWLVMAAIFPFLALWRWRKV